MELGFTVGYQVGIMFILIIIGFIVYKVKLISEAGIKDMSNLLLMIVTPCVLIESYQREFDSELAKQFGIAVLLSIAVHIIAIVVAKLVFAKQKTPELKKITSYTSIYSNCGFMGIPLLSAALGSEGVFLGSAYLAVFCIFYWTHGLFLYTGDKKYFLSKEAILNPGVIGVVIGLVLFFTGVELPDIIMAPISGLAALNTPLAMIVIGSFLAKANLGRALRNPGVYLVSFARLLLIPMLVLILLFVTKTDKLTGTAILLQAACPSAAIGSLFAVKYGLDPVYPAEIISITTILSIITIPLIVFISSFML